MGHGGGEAPALRTVYDKMAASLQAFLDALFHLSKHISNLLD